MLKTIDDRWNALHESVRWVLWLPAALLLTAGISFLFQLSVGIPASAYLPWAGDLAAATVASAVLLPAIYMLIPRAKRFATTLVFAIITLLNIIVVFRFGMLLLVSGEHVQHGDIKDLLQTIIWLTAGTCTWLACWRGEFSK